MTNANQRPVSLPRLEFSNQPKLVITAPLRKQINRLHSRVGNKEWSGELITRQEGKITDLSKWMVYGEDIFLNDIGTGTLTEYTAGAGAWKQVDIMDLFESFPGIMDGSKKNHHIHTHHSMGAFFSGTDWHNLEERASSANYAIMLIVDFQGTYKAKVAFKANVTTPGTPAGDRVISLANNVDGFIDFTLPVEATEDHTEETLVVMDMEVVHELVEVEATDWFDTRFLSVQKSMEEESKRVRPSAPAQEVNHGYINGRPYHRNGGFIQREMFEDTYDKEWEDIDPSQKNIGDLTDKEWEKLNTEVYEKKITLKEAHIWINSVIYGDLETTYDISPLSTMKQSNSDTKTDIYEEARHMLIDMNEFLEQLFPGSDETFYIDSLEFVNTNILDKATDNKLAQALSIMINKEISKLSKRGLCL
jgi:hypothetical protein